MSHTCTQLAVVYSLLLTYTGGLFLYAVLVLSLFWLSQTVVYFWVVIYPINFRSFNTSGKLRAIHLASVITALTFPVVPVVVAMYFSRGVVLSIFTPHKCIPGDVDIFFYSFSVPLVVIIICAISLLVTTLWHVGNVVRSKFHQVGEFD